MKDLIQQLAEVQKFYESSAEQTKDVKLQLMLQQLADEKAKYAADISDSVQADIEVDPRVEFSSNLSDALNYVRLLTARQDVELISLCEKKERKVLDNIQDTMDQKDLTLNMKKTLDRISILTRKTIKFLQEEMQEKQINA